MSKKFCKSCVLSESEYFHLSSTGLCKLCASPNLNSHIFVKPDTLALENLIKKIRYNGKGRKYDCVVGWSGGRDSTHLIVQLATKLNLRCLAVFGKTPFTPPEIIRNVRTIAEKLNVDLIEVDTPAHHQTVARFCLEQYKKTKAPIFINLACASCKYINMSIFKIAHEYNVRSVVYGGNRFEYLPSGPASVDINAEDRYSFFNMVKDNLLRISKGIYVLLRNPAILRYLGVFLKASLLYVNQYTIWFRLVYPKIFRFDYYHYADWNESEVEETLRIFEWALPEDCTSTWRADCIFEAVKNTAFLKQLGFTYSQALYSNLIRAGKLSREEALRRLSQEGISEPRLKKALEICGLDTDVLK
ncbi:MAG: hypothetical protein LWX56_13780 [Ignavibacteria bacterium]|nr:hypothetical protein [Ignavibacteria bacterium]